VPGRGRDPGRHVDELATDRGRDRPGHRHAGEHRCGAGEVERHDRKHELHDLLAEHLPADAVLVGIDTPDGPWVAALIATCYQVFAINPRQAARARDRHSMSCAKSDTGDAHVLAYLVRIDAVLARVHQTLI
jgi:hypothetical protein